MLLFQDSFVLINLRVVLQQKYCRINLENILFFLILKQSEKNIQIFLCANRWREFHIEEVLMGKEDLFQYQITDLDQKFFHD